MWTSRARRVGIIAAVAVAVAVAAWLGARDRAVAPVARPTPVPGLTPTRSPAVPVGTVQASPVVLVESGRMAELTAAATVRAAPARDAAEIARLDELRLVFAFEPRAYQWWRRIEFSTDDGEDVFGWIEDPMDTAVRPLSLTCPARSDVVTMVGMTSPERLGCYGNRELVLSPVIAGARTILGEPAYTGDPSWLASASTTVLFGRAGEVDDSGSIDVHIAPESFVPRHQWISVVGHFDDKVSPACHRTPDRPPFVAEQAEEQVFWCRQRFVITQWAPTAAPPTP